MPEEQISCKAFHVSLPREQLQADASKATFCLLDRVTGSSVHSILVSFLHSILASFVQSMLFGLTDMIMDLVILV